ncbi:olfactory receptor 11G2-like [Rhinophrynus dorsalis]
MSLMLTETKTISFAGCFTQLYFFASFASAECFLLLVMSYDRYLAICNPLRYSSVMNFQRCLHLVFCAWVAAFILTLNVIVRVLGLQFCGPNVIDHFFCDLAPIMELSCSDTTLVDSVNLLVGFPASFLPLMFIIAIYFYIFHTILRIPSTTGRQKAFYTCSSHLTVVSIYYGTLITSYMFDSKERSLSLKKVLSFLYTVVTPFLNPVIYSLRNKDIKSILAKLTHVKIL